MPQLLYLKTTFLDFGGYSATISKTSTVIYFLNITWENNSHNLHECFFLELRRDKLKADKKGNLKEVATLANYLGELLAKIGKIWSDASLLIINNDNVIYWSLVHVQNKIKKTILKHQSWWKLFMYYLFMYIIQSFNKIFSSYLVCNYHIR